MLNDTTIKLVECPRDAMQGWKRIIPTEQKIQYLESLLKVGFDTLDCGSFVSPKAIPQMADTKEVISKLSMANTATRLLVIVANERGGAEAVQFDKISYLGFPFSISPTFQQLNTNATIEESLQRVKVINQLCLSTGKQLVIYLSMGFGNPYGDEYSPEILLKYAEEMISLGVQTISLADTVGVATPEQVSYAVDAFINSYPEVEVGVHLHSTAHNWKEKMEAAVNAGCKRFDGALKGIGGCPMANNDLVGNMNTEWMIAYLQQRNLAGMLDVNALKDASRLAEKVFV